MNATITVTDSECANLENFVGTIAEFEAACRPEIALIMAGDFPGSYHKTWIDIEVCGLSYSFRAEVGRSFGGIVKQLSDYLAWQVEQLKTGGKYAPYIKADTIPTLAAIVAFIR